jgi:hypothetical protein
MVAYRTADAIFSSGARPSRVPTPTQLAAIRNAMQLFIEDDLARGVSPSASLPCAACGRLQPQPGFIHYAPYHLCNACALHFEVARISGLVTTIDRFVREHELRASAGSVLRSSLAAAA